MRAQALGADPPVVLGSYPASLFERVERFLRWVHTREWNHFFGADYDHADHPSDTLEDFREWILKKHAPAANVARRFDRETDQYMETDESKAAVHLYQDQWFPIAEDGPNKVHPFKRVSIERMKDRVWEEDRSLSQERYQALTLGARATPRVHHTALRFFRFSPGFRDGT